ncbi:MAG: hypothetical protein ACE5LF_02990, partial [Alphaproteobacteria bacterium]
RLAAQRPRRASADATDGSEAVTHFGKLFFAAFASTAAGTFVACLAAPDLHPDVLVPCSMIGALIGGSAGWYLALRHGVIP